MGSQGHLEPIAIVGLGCRLPGDISSPSGLWDFLAQGRSAQSDFPANRLNIASWYHPDASRPGSFATKGGYFLGGGDSFRDFDPSFFGISPLEAASMDPQQRKLLEVVYESFESAGLGLDDVSGSDTGCFVGNFTWDVGQMQARDVDFGSPYQMTGGGLTILSNRVNYVFNLKGPSLTLDTACSSTMYALHLACQSLRARDCSAAVVGGTNLIFGVEQQLGSVRLGTLSPTSTCHTFDESADGYARAEAVGSIYIKRLSDAVRDGNPIRAVIRATAINTNGKGPGISHPSAAQQETVMRKAYAEARLGFSETGYFESHGTGTPVGDPVELEAIGNVFGSLRRPETPLLVGSVKTNLGHGEAASAIPSLIKVILSLENGLIPATIGIKRLNPALDLHGGALKIVQQLTPWPREHSYRRASVNSFGYGGANAHTILDAVDSYFGELATTFRRLRPLGAMEGHQVIKMSGFGGHGVELSNGINGPDAADSKAAVNHGHALESRNGVHGHTVKAKLAHGGGHGGADSNSRSQTKTYLLPFSAHNDQTLLRNFNALSQISDNCPVADLAHTLSKARGSLPSRAFALVSRPKDGTAGQLRHDELRFGGLANEAPTLAFVFTGQGAQWPQMGVALVDEYPSLRHSIDKMDALLGALPEPPPWTIMDTLREPAATSSINEAERSQTVCTALQVAVVELLRSWGVRPKAVVGHSSGEIAAAFAAGLITSAQAITIAYLRGRAVSRNNCPGAMLAVGVGARAVSAFIGQTPDIAIACHNSPDAVTLSGTEAAVDEAHGVFSRSGVFSRKLVTSRNAYHSPLMRLAAVDYERRLLEHLGGDRTAVPEPESPVMFSSVTGERVASPIPLAYWRQNLESPVLFNQATQSLLRSLPNLQHVVEIGPHSALGGPIKQIRAAVGRSEEQLGYISTLKRNTSGVDSVLSLVGSLFLGGHAVDLQKVNADQVLEDAGDGTLSVRLRYGSFLLDLPRYQWVYEELYWSESRMSSEIRFREHPRHEMLGSLIPGSSASSPSWRNMIYLDQLPWLRHHKVGNDIVFPAAGYISQAIAAAAQSSGLPVDASTYTLRNVKILSAMVLQEGRGTESVLDLRAINADKTEFDFTVSSVSLGQWASHASGTVRVSKAATSALSTTAIFSAEARVTRNGVNQATQDRRWYKKMKDVGLEYGPSFQTMSNIQSTTDQFQSLANVDLAASRSSVVEDSAYPLHPTVIDACLQLSIIAAHRGDPDNLIKAYLPVAIDEVTLVSSAAAAAAQPSTLRGRGRPLGLRYIKTAVELKDGNGKPLLQARMGFLSLEGSIGSQPVPKIPQPYSRLVWKPDINHLSNDQIDSLFSDPATDRAARECSAKLEELAALVILQISESLPSPPVLPAGPPRLEGFIEWINKESQSLSYSDLGALPRSLRETRVHEIVHDISKTVPEAATIASLGSQMPAILSGEIDPKALFDEELGFLKGGAYSKLQKLMDLISHEDPRLTVLELGNGNAGPSKRMLSTLRGHHAIPNYVKYHFSTGSKDVPASVKESFKAYHKLDFVRLDIDQDPAAQYDIIFAPNVGSAKGSLAGMLRHCRKLLKPGGRLVLLEPVRSRLAVGLLRGMRPGFSSQGDAFLSKFEWHQQLLEAGFSGADLVVDDYPDPSSFSSLIVSKATAVRGGSGTVAANMGGSGEGQGEVILLYRHEPHPLLAEVEKLYRDRSVPTRRMAFTDFPRSGSDKARTIMMAELEGPLLSRMSESEMAAMRDFTQMASTAVWVTNGDVLDGREPEKTLVFGISKSIMTEQPSFHLSSIDVDPDATGAALCRSARLVVELEVEFHQNPDDMNTELVEKRGIVYTSRYIGDDGGNDEFARAWMPPTVEQPVRGNLSLSFGKTGRLDSYYFEHVSAPVAIGETEVEVASRAFALDQAGLAVMRGQKIHPYYSWEVGGIVTKTGAKVQGIQVGDQVVCLKPNTFETTLQVEQNLVSRLGGSAKMGDIVGSLVPYTFAIHSLFNVCRVARNDHVLVDVSSPALAYAMVRVAARSGCSVYATYSSREMRDALETVKNVKLVDSASHLARAMPSTASLRAVVTNGSLDLSAVLRGADGGAHLALLPGRASTDLAELFVALTSRGLVVSYLDVLEIASCNQSQVSSAMREALHLLENGLVHAKGVKSFDFSQFNDAVAAVGSSQIRAAITCDPKATQVPIKQPPPEPLKFDSNGTYLLIGCLGGLGRCLTTWMIARGARNFIFLSRSGADKPEAAALIKDLEGMSQGQTYSLCLQVARGDVSKRSDVAAAISLAKTPIKGVIQAAMVLHELIFSTMSLQQWNQVIQPKVLGSINLHELLRHEDLDFFVMTSSVLGAIGAATQSNYSAANAFLDAMARHRHSLGLQATSVALGMILDVGHVEEHPEVEVALKRNGMYGIGVAEFLHAMEASCRRRDTSQPPWWGYDSGASAHIVTGMDPTRVTRAGGKGMWLRDTRLRGLLLAIGGDAGPPSGDGGGSSSQGTVARLKAAAETGGEEAVKAVVQQLLMERLSKLVLLPVKKMNAQKALSTYGMDSMISAELRSWTWKEFKADIPFMSLLHQTLTFQGLAEQVVSAMASDYKG